MHRCPASTLDLFCNALRAMGDSTFAGVMEFDRRLEPARLHAAYRACVLAHPVLRSRLVTGSGPAFWEMADEPCLPPVCPEPCGGDYRDRVAWPVDPAGTPQCRVRLLRREAGDVVVMSLSHAAADASGLHTLMAQLLQEYRKPGSIAPAEGGIPVRDTLWTAAPARGLPEPPAQDALNPFWPDPFGTSEGACSFHREVVRPAELAGIRAGAKATGGTLNDAIVAAYFLAMSGLTGTCGPVEVFFPVDLRQHLRDGSRVMSNQSGTVSFPLARDEGDGMDDLLPRVIARTRALKAGGIGIAEQAAWDRACDPEGHGILLRVAGIQARQQQGFADIFLSNPGPFTLPAVPGLRDAYVCYPGTRMPATTLVTSTFRGQMTITISFQDSCRPREGTKEALRLFCGHLRSVAGGH